ncbi:MULTISPECIES: phosphoribosyltransferase family protein [unclassified Streptomyces]|uniref:phosphoribosyltransferase n=1 Tax=unclassified Streptomyces TaxID=2593676 RepID=UPI0033A80FB2
MTQPLTRTESAPVQRVFEHKRIWNLDQEAFQTAAALIAAHEPRPDAVIGIARGGVPLARELATHFGVEAIEITARHNTTDDLYLEATGRVQLPTTTADALGRLASGQRLLVADDICGTGATFKAVLPFLTERLAPGQLRSAVLCRSRAADFTPDTWVWDTLDWVLFPWNEPTDQHTEDLAAPAAVRTKESL